MIGDDRVVVQTKRRLTYKMRLHQPWQDWGDGHFAAAATIISESGGGRCLIIIKRGQYAYLRLS